MGPRTRHLLAACLALSAACAAAKEPAKDREALLLGAWSCVRACPDEEMAFEVSDGERTFATWLHHRPSFIGGRWRLDGDRITVTRDGTPHFEWRLVWVTKSRLVMRDADPPGKEAS
jgi:hypothetical protein